MSTAQPSSKQNILRTIAPHAAAIGIFLVLSCMYFFPQFSGKQIAMSDIMQFQGMSREAVKYEEETGIQTLWTNSMFSGMPTYQITAWPDANKVSWIENALNLFLERPAGYFIFAQISFYFMLIMLGVNRWVAIFSAFAFAFTTSNIMLFEAGHTSKLRTLFSAPLIIAGTVLAFRNKYIIGGLLFCIGLALNIFTNHPQITYYIGLCVGVYGLIELIRAIRSKTLPAFGKAAGVLVAGAVLAFLASAHMLLSTLEYSHDTMRGKPTLSAPSTADPSSSSQVDGLAWDYAMQWSNGVADVLAIIVPRAAGGSSSEPTPEGSAWHELLRSRGVPPQEAPLYWGPLPFTSGPQYFGAIIMFLFLLGALIIRGHLKWWIVGIVIVTIFLSMGKHFEAFNRLIFNYLPLYNKFRAPSQILTITAMFVPILAALALSQFFRTDMQSKQMRNALLYSYAGMGGLSLLLAIAGTGLFDFSHANDARYAQANILEPIMSDRKSLFRADAFRSFILITLAFGALWALHKGWIRKTGIAVAIISVLTIFDVWMIDRRYIAPDDFVPDRQVENHFTPDAIDQQILQDKSLHYRVHDLSTDPFNNSTRAYFHHMIGGYHAAKLQRYQDIIERYLSKGNEAVLNMLNAKYFIVPDAEGNPMVRQNTQAMGNAWFVEEIRIVNTPEEEIAALEHFDPGADVIVHKEFEHLVKGLNPVKGGTITLTEYAPNRLKYTADAPSDQIAVFSEIWYGPDKGWHVTIDGQPSELFRANYLLRAVNVPAGKHVIEMVFRPARYYVLKTVALVVSLLIVLGFGYLVYLLIKKGAIETPLDSRQLTTQPNKPGRTRKGKKS